MNKMTFESGDAFNDRWNNKNRFHNSIVRFLWGVLGMFNKPVCDVFTLQASVYSEDILYTYI